MTYGVALTVDLLTLGLCGFLMLRFARLTHAHPGTIYVFFHVFSFTLRLIALMSGSPPLFGASNWSGQVEPLREEEIVRAMFLADLALGVMTIAFIWAARRTERVVVDTPALGLNVRWIWAMAFIAIPIGVWGLATYAAVPGLSEARARAEGFDASSYALIIQSWPGLALLALIYCHGFKPWLLLPMLGFLALMALQGFHRFRAVLPALLLAQIWLESRGWRWPKPWMVALVAALGLAFFPLKTVGRMAQTGASPAEIWETSVEIIRETLEGKGEDHLFLDQFASAVSLVDESGKHYYGEPYLALLVLPVPRHWWPEKPSIADYLDDLSRPWRPMKENGMIVTVLGEAYANFGHIGLLLVPFGLAFVLARLHHRAMQAPFLTVRRFAYLLVAANLIQVFRDGLTSLVIFVVVNMLPLTLLVIAHQVATWVPGRSSEQLYKFEVR